MSLSKQVYLIMLAADGRFCAGARDLAPAAPLRLKTYDEHDPTLCWWFDADGLIRAAAEPGLCLEVREVSGGTGLACLGRLMPGKLAQQWRHADNVIASQLYPKLVLDNADGRAVPGNPVQVRALAPFDARQWRLQAVQPAERD